MSVNDFEFNFFNLSSDLLCIIDHEGKFIKVNPAWKSILGYENSEILGKTIFDFIHPDDLRSSSEAYEEHKEGTLIPHKFRNRYLCKDGTYKWLEWTGDVADGLCYSSARECSDTHETDIRYEVALNAANIGIFDLNLVTHELIWDKRMYEIFDVDPKTATNDLDMWKKCVHPDDLENSLITLQKAIDEKTPFYTEFRIFHRSGEVRYLEGYAHLYLDENGNPVRLLGANTDSTERRLLEAQNIEQQQIVEHQSKLAALGTLAAAVGHEINNPLNILMGYNDVLKSQINDGNLDLSDLNKSLDIQKDASLRIKNITDELRSFSRKDDNILKSVNLHEVIEHALNFIIPLMDKSGVQFNVELPSESIVIKGTESKIHQILINLLINAKDSIEDSDNKNISLYTKTSESEVTVFVKDSGCGIDKDLQSKIFEPFFTSKKVNKGTGLGLSLSYSFANLLGGKLYLEESSPSGSCFGLVLNVSDIPS